MRLKKKISIVKYIILFCLVLSFLISAVMIIGVTIISDNAVRQTVKGKLYSQIRKAQRYVTWEGETFVMTEKVKKLDEEFHFAILSEDNCTVLIGEYPYNFDFTDIKVKEIQNNKLYYITSGNEKYYALDMIFRVDSDQEDKIQYKITGFINENDVDTIYQKIKLYTYIGVVSEFALILFIGIVLRHRISKPMNSMCEQASRISENLTLSERIDYDGIFKEPDILIRAYNTLLSNMRTVVERQEQFNSDISHELRTPVTVIRAQLQLAREQTEFNRDAVLRETFEVIDRQSAKMNSMINQLLKLSHMEQDNMELDAQEFDLLDIVASVCEEEEGQGTHPFEYKLESALVNADVALITVAIRNLVSNAVKYSPPQSKICVSCGKDKRGSYITIRDFGFGIEPEALPHIFEYYYRTEKSRNSDGFGLGLTIAMKIAKKHNGTIEVESVLGEGSEFTFILP